MADKIQIELSRDDYCKVIASLMASTVIAQQRGREQDARDFFRITNDIEWQKERLHDG